MYCSPCLQRRMNNTFQKAEPGGGRPGSGGNCKPDEQEHWEVFFGVGFRWGDTKQEQLL